MQVQIPAAALRDTHGNPIAAYIGNFELDIDASSYTELAGELAAQQPRGSLIYDPVVTASVGHTGDSDRFTLNVDPGQTITVVVNPDESLSPTLSLIGPGISAGPISAAQGEDVVIQTAGLTMSSGEYTLTVSGEVFGGGKGGYSVQVILNAAVEQEANNSTADSQDIEASFIPLAKAATRGAVMGGIEYTGFLGPDGFGYEAASSETSLAIPSEFQFEDISGSGKRIGNLDGVDDARKRLGKNGVVTGFTFDFYGTDYTEREMYVSSNGTISLGAGYKNSSNTDLTGKPNQAIIDPPLTPAAPAGDSPDGNLEGRITPRHALLVANWLSGNQVGNGLVEDLDANRDGDVLRHDTRAVTKHLSLPQPAVGALERAPSVHPDPRILEHIFADLDDDEDDLLDDELLAVW